MAILIPKSPSLYIHRLRRADCRAGAAADALVLVNLVLLVGARLDGVCGAVLRAEGAADAVVGDGVADQRAAALGGAAACLGGAPRTRRGNSAAWSAPGSARSGPGRRGWCGGSARQRSSSRSMSPLLPSPSQRRSRISSIRFVPMRQKVHLPQDSFCVNWRKNRAMSTMQAVSSITTSPPEPIIAPRLGQLLVVNARVAQRRGDAAAGRAADLHGLELAPVADAAADLLDDLADRDAHRHLDQPAAHDLAGEREDLGALARRPCRCAANASAPWRMIHGHVRVGLHVVDARRHSPEAVTRPGRAGGNAACRAGLRARRSGRSPRRRRTRRRPP